MTTLHMETDSARAVSNKMLSSVDSLQGILLSLTSDVSNLGSAWVGNSSTEFQSEFSSWSNSMKQMAENLEVLRTRLEVEISEWESMASKLA